VPPNASPEGTLAPRRSGEAGVGSADAAGESAIPVTVQHDRERSFIFTHTEGDLRASELVAVSEELMRACRGWPRIRHLALHTDVTLRGVELDHVRRVAQVSRRFLKHHPDARTALVYDDGNTYGLGRLFAGLLGVTGAPIRAFRCEAEAREWLEVPSTAAEAPLR
jgi:hypothetical protein